MEGQVRWAESYETRRWGGLVVSSMGCGGVIRGDVWVPCLGSGLSMDFVSKKWNIGGGGGGGVDGYA